MMMMMMMMMIIIIIYKAHFLHNAVVSHYYGITGMGNIYRDIRTIVITVKPSPEKQR